MIEIGGGIALALILVLLWYNLNVLPYLFLGGLLYMLYRLTSGKLPQLNHLGFKSRPVSKILFDQIGGQEMAKKELLEALDFIKNPMKIKKMGIRPLKGILLIGPPGTGKTLLARAAAGYTDSVFVSAVGSEFIEMYAGVGAQRVRQLFKQCRDQAKAQKKNNAVLFIDELDILGTKRGSHSSHMEYDQTLNQLLTEMDGLTLNEDVNILVVGATNRPEALDPALVRP
ncbi:MAG: AAA family ATPase, partial [Firmicutes bacterium]|nr:AAA family ATPase [Bacillota bacterium]